MTDLDPAASGSLTRLPDGTLKQVSPVTGTVVWTVPGRSHRPVPAEPAVVRDLAPGWLEAACAFCPARLLETPPERARLVLDGPGGPAAHSAPSPQAGPPEWNPDVHLPDGWRLLRDVPAEALWDQPAPFRRIPNLYPILPFDYWRADHGLEVSVGQLAHARAYLASPAGRAHVSGLLAARARAAGSVSEASGDVADVDLLDQSRGLFASTHDLIVARRHFAAGARTDDQLAASGDLTPQEHHVFLVLTVDALRDLTESNPHAHYVSVFQNWRRPAGASFDHLHKQLVAIDEWGPLMQRVVARLAESPELFNVAVADPAARLRLMIGENEHAVALAGVGHRYPTIEVYATGTAQRPWEQPPGALRAVSDLLHACHAATGSGIATNEEWHYRPVAAELAMPWRINLKWRVSTLAGFEGGTRINVNTIDPFALRELVVADLQRLRASGRIAPMRIGDECAHRPGVLQYARA
jgi:galactose-1-phosphate uridylyltransferase